MRQQLTVHIGTPKTGSSSLQHALHDGVYSTHRVRVAYPQRLSEVDLAQAMARGLDDRVARRLTTLERWLSTADADVFALSSEHFIHVPADTFASAMRRHLPGWSARTFVACYVRPHGPQVVSAFAEQRKSGAFLGSMDDFLRRVEHSRRFHYADRLAAWDEAYGDRFVARPMSPSCLVGGDVVTDFLHLVTSGDSVEVHAQRLNMSLTVEALALLGVVHRTLREADVPDGVAHRIGKRIANDLSAAGVADRGRRLWLSAPQAQIVAASFAEEAARLDAAFCPGSEPFTQCLRGLTAEAPLEAPDLHPTSYADRRTLTSIRREAAALAGVCAEHGQPWVAQFRAAKGYRCDPAALRSQSAARVEAALEQAVSSLAAALRALP
jgi:hypothetical protein